MNRYTLIWTTDAVKSLKRLLVSDPQAAKDARRAIFLLVTDPYPENSTPLAVATLRRLRVVNARVVYEVNETHRSIEILMIGRVSGRS